MDLFTKSDYMLRDIGLRRISDGLGENRLVADSGLDLTPSDKGLMARKTSSSEGGSDARQGFTTKLVSWVFRIAGAYGIILLTPFYWLEARIGDLGVPITHPEYFYGFVGTALSFQLVFWIVASDPVRFRPIIAASVAEKLAFGLPAWVLYYSSCVEGDLLAFGTIDLAWAVAFAASFFLVSNRHRLRTSYRDFAILRSSQDASSCEAMSKRGQEL